MKYVMFKVATDVDDYRLMPIIFPNQLVHADVVKRIRRCFNELGTADPVSAGSCYPDGTVDPTSKSETLRLSAHPDDEAIIKTFDHLHGLVHKRDDA